VIEMNVRAVKRAGEDRLVAVLERGDTGTAPPARAEASDAPGTDEREPAPQRPGRLLITISRPEAHVIYHELRAEKTMPGQTFELIAEIVSQLHGRLTAVELVADEGGRPSARLRLERSEGRSTVSTRAGQALALAVHLKVPLLVAEALLAQDKGSAGAKAAAQAAGAAGAEASDGATLAAAEVGDEATPPVEVPEVFLRAFEE
jgi:bifunctional DNase/RNase